MPSRAGRVSDPEVLNVRTLLASSLALSLCLASALAGAAEHEIVAATGGGALTSTWRSDIGAYAPFELSYRYKELVSLDVLTRLGYAPVDQRMLTYLSIAASVWGHLGKAQPYARVALVHQHEESRPAIDADPGGALFGVGNGIRHRGGFAGSLGFDVPIQHVKNTGNWFVGLDSGATFFPDNRGPSWYFAASAWLGFALDLRGGS